MTTAYDFFGARAPDMADSATSLGEEGTALWQADLINKTIWWNRKAQHLHAVGEDYQPNFENAFEFCSLDDRTHIRNILSNSIQNAVPWRFEYTAELPGGDTLLIESEGYPVVENGKTTKLIGRFARKELVLSKTQLSSSTLPDTWRYLNELTDLHAVVDETAILSVSDASGKILRVNKNLLRVSGYSADELIGQNHNLMNSGYHSKEFFQQMWETISCGKIWRGEICNRSKQGETLWFDTIIYPVTDTIGRPDKFFALRFDVTEKVRSSRLVSAFFDISSAPNFILDDHGYILKVNPAFCAAAGHTKKDLLGRHFNSLANSGDRSKVTKALRKALLGRKSNALQIRLHSRHDKQRIMDVHFNRFEGQIFGSANDITEQLERQQSLADARNTAEEANQSKTAFLANMSHEIRTPLNAIVGITDVLNRDPDLTAKQQDLVKTIYEAGEMLEDLLSDFLDLSKIEAGKLTIESIPFCPSVEAQAALQLHMQKAERKGLRFSLQANANTENLALGDPLRLRQIISNLASNAVKFTDCGQISCSLSVQKAAFGEKLVFEIEDSGIGFPTKTSGAVFERYTQQRETDSRTHGGTGLGLAISASLAHKMGGTLRVISAPDEGTIFTLTLPLRSALSKAPVQHQQAAKLEELDLSGCRVLVAEDSKVNQKVISLVLQNSDCDITFTSNGVEALETFKEEPKPFDLVLMDMRMPVMDGEQAVRNMRVFESENKRARTPIIMLSANAMPNNVKDALTAGCDAHVAKPVRRGILFQKIAECLDLTKGDHAGV
ncbi:PAS domain-containing hybrid sensor histidine kinase/response regulator [Shimia sp. MMG029]|uniref:PAS domain-containing hybrid sensor histidine kinase/response regulator n=1 Tax=Shimia sp. MMG029 TaxID=3021978 RepID=UPI0022FEF3EC|nr:PAS domain-containing hybrid sensor histidine kinase/response regulator [Shimia sp. MMG029]MDA5558273.1 ATP-binding protein [Shimia sp. MMG029]